MTYRVKGTCLCAQSLLLGVQLSLRYYVYLRSGRGGYLRRRELLCLPLLGSKF
jgi:hypothetical protein